MITQAITEMKQKKGSSRVAILKHIAGATNSVPNAVLVKKGNLDREVSKFRQGRNSGSSRLRK